jgi:hypothetical protein
LVNSNNETYCLLGYGVAYVDRYVKTFVKEPTNSIHYPEDGSSRFPCKISAYLPEYAVSDTGLH